MTDIVGAGAAGLSLGVMLNSAHRPFHIWEAEPGPGGLCRSTVWNGFTFDQGPHILGGIPDAVQWIVQSTGIKLLPGTTCTRGFYGGEFVAHPFADETVGRAYMGKMWKADPGALSLPGLAAQQGRKPGGVPTFLYPARGGYQAITDAWAARLDGAISYGTTAERAEQVWTGPVEGRYNGLSVLTAGFQGPPPPYTAVYTPEPWTPFHRFSFPSAFSPTNAPPGCYSVQAECSWADASPPGLGEAFFEAMDRLGFSNGPRIFAHARNIPDAYPVPFGTTSSTGHGRTGGHRYLNLDGVVDASHRLADLIR